MTNDNTTVSNNTQQEASVVASLVPEKPRQDEDADAPTVDGEAQSRALAEVEESAGESNLERLRRKVAEHEEKIGAQREQILRMQADFENYRRRQQNSLEDVKFLARESIMSNILPLVDNLERALQALQTTGNIEALAAGLRLILKQMNDVFEREGMTAIESDGQPFDPSLHEAVMTEERDDLPDHTIVETLQKGYRLGSRVLRPSLVKVSQTSTNPKEEN